MLGQSLLFGLVKEAGSELLVPHSAFQAFGHWPDRVPCSLDRSLPNVGRWSFLPLRFYRIQPSMRIIQVLGFFPWPASTSSNPATLSRVILCTFDHSQLGTWRLGSKRPAQDSRVWMIDKYIRIIDLGYFLGWGFIIMIPAPDWTIQMSFWSPEISLTRHR